MKVITPSRCLQSYWRLAALSNITALILCGATAAAEGLNHWQWRNPLPAANPLYDITWGSGVFVAVGEGGCIQNSGDGLAWDSLGRVVTNRLNRVSLLNGLFVAVGDGGAILTSPDGRAWSNHSVVTTNALTGIAFGNGRYLAVGANGTVVASTDGVGWTVSYAGLTNGLTGIAFGGGVFVAGVAGKVGASPAVLVSLNGSYWQAVNMSTSAATDSQVVYGNGEFLACVRVNEMVNTTLYNYGFFSSADGTHWSKGSYANFYHSGLSVANSRFVEMGGTWQSGQGTVAALAFSSDGQQWSNVSMPLSTPMVDYGTTQGFNYPMAGVAYGAGRYVALAPWGFMVVSTNETAWTTLTQGVRGRITHLAFGQGVCVAAGDGRCWIGSSGLYGFGMPILVSTNGLSFAAAASSATKVWSSVAFGSNVFVAVGGGGALQRSSDGGTWTTRPSATTHDLISVCCGSNEWVAVGAAGTVVGSTAADGLVWSIRNSGTEYQLNGVTYAKGLYVAVGQLGTILTSPDGSTWTPQFVDTMNDLVGVAYGNGQFIAVGANGTVVRSLDGQTWLTGTAGTSAPLWSVAFGQGQFVAVASGSPIGSFDEPFMRNELLASYDGITWRSLTLQLPSCWGLYGVGFQNDRCWVGGGEGAILESDAIAASPVLDGYRLDGGRFGVRVLGVVPTAYRLQVATTLQNPAWSDWLVVTNAQGGENWTDTNAIGSTMRFYRLVSP